MPTSRVIELSPPRLVRWVTGFGERHGGIPADWTADGDRLTFTASDGASAVLEVPFPPLPADWESADPLAAIVAHANRRRRIGVLLVRLGGYAVGVFDGDKLTASKVGSRLVHGRSSAGGWSQHRFARRREGQARVALDSATETAVAVLAPVAASLDAVVTGGDRRAIATVLADVRLAEIAAKATTRVLDVPDPRLAVLRRAPELFGSIRVTLTEP
jgi:hypothetical protein